MRTVSTCALCALFVTGALAGCTASSEDVRPPPDELFFPSGVAVSPPGSPSRVVFVANANSELRFDSGTIAVLDRAEVDDVIRRRAANPKDFDQDCEIDPQHRETLVCDEQRFIIEGAGVRIGNFATDIALQDFSAQQPGTVHYRVFVPTRGDPSVSWADFDGAKLTCASPADDVFAQCDDAHRLTSVQNDPDQLPIPDEPFAVFADGASGTALVTHLTTGSVSLIDSPADRDAAISDIMVGLFNPGAPAGATGVAGRRSGSDELLLYVGARSEDRIQTLAIGRPANQAPPYLLASNHFFLDGVGNSPGVGGSSDSRGLAFSPDGNRLYVVNRRPPSLQIIDTSTGPTGAPRNVTVGASDICRQASTVAVVDSGDGERAYVTCFQDGEVYVIDPRGQSLVEDILTVGRGPYAIAAAPDNKQLFVSNFLEDTIAVIDIDPASPHRNRVVLRIGRPRAP